MRHLKGYAQLSKMVVMLEQYCNCRKYNEDNCPTQLNWFVLKNLAFRDYECTLKSIGIKYFYGNGNSTHNLATLPTEQNQSSVVKVGSSNGDDGGGGVTSENVSPSVSLIATVRPLARSLAKSVTDRSSSGHSWIRRTSNMHDKVLQG